MSKHDSLIKQLDRAATSTEALAREVEVLAAEFEKMDLYAMTIQESEQIRKHQERLGAAQARMVLIAALYRAKTGA